MWEKQLLIEKLKKSTMVFGTRIEPRALRKRSMSVPTVMAAINSQSRTTPGSKTTSVTGHESFTTDVGQDTE
jgi:hypothetical protein